MTPHEATTCMVDGCDAVVRFRNRCNSHYRKAYRRGEIGLQTPEERFWSKVDRRGDDECWEWTASRNHFGYGKFSKGNSWVRAHRFSWELANGPIPDGLVIDHLCRNTACVNPAHLEPVTHRENVLRGCGPVARAARATHCPQGHPYDEENTYRRPVTGHRSCRACNVECCRRRSAA